MDLVPIRILLFGICAFALKMFHHRIFIKNPVTLKRIGRVHPTFGMIFFVPEEYDAQDNYEQDQLLQRALQLLTEREDMFPAGCQA